MKNSGFVLRLFAVAVLLTFGVALLAQSEPQATQGGRHRPMMQTPEQRLDRMAKNLDLTDDQKTKIKPILENETEKRKALMEDSSMSREDRRAKFMELQQKTTEDIKAVLNPDQQKKFDEMRSRMMERRGRGGPGRQGDERPQAPPPSQ